MSHRFTLWNAHGGPRSGVPQGGHKHTQTPVKYATHFTEQAWLNKRVHSFREMIKMSKFKPDEISKAIKQSPSDALAFGRTAMANERTLLSFLRTSIGLLAGGIGIVGFVERPLIVALGWFAIFISIPFLVWGIRKYRKIKRLITEVGTEIFLSDKNPEQ